MAPQLQLLQAGRGINPAIFFESILFRNYLSFWHMALSLHTKQVSFSHLDKINIMVFCITILQIASCIMERQRGYLDGRDKKFRASG